jgi:phosphohistidine phosphatase SixA
MQTNLAMFECLKLQALSNLLLLNHNPLIGKLHNAISLRNQEYYGHRFIA